MTMASSNNEFSYSARSIRNGLLSGYAAGITGVVIGHPLDSVKVLMQTNGGASFMSSAHRSSSRVNAPASYHVISRASAPNVVAVPAGSSPVKANVSTVAVPGSLPSGSILGNRSIRALYAGITGPLLTIGILQSINFAVYDSVRRVLYERQLQSQQKDDRIVYSRKAGDYLHCDNLSNVAVASFISGASISVLTSPMMIVKTKQQLMVWGFQKAIRETYIKERNGKWNVINGIRNFYTGFGVHFICETFGRSVYMFSYELFKRQMALVKANDQMTSADKLSVPERMFCAASAGMMSWVFIFPVDVIRSKLYADSLTTQSNSTTVSGINLARQMVNELGLRSLYRGMGITVARAGPVAAAVLPVYDAALAWLSSP